MSKFHKTGVVTNMEKGNERTIQLRASHITQITTIQKQLIGYLYLKLKSCTSEKGKEVLKKKLAYIEGLSASQIAALLLNFALSNDGTINYLNHTIDLHILFNQISGRQFKLENKSCHHRW